MKHFVQISVILGFLNKLKSERNLECIYNEDHILEMQGLEEFCDYSFEKFDEQMPQNISKRPYCRLLTVTFCGTPCSSPLILIKLLTNS